MKTAADPQQKQFDVYPKENNVKMEKEQNVENNTTSFSLLKESMQSKDIQPLRKRGQRGPTLIMKAQDGQKIAGAIQLQHSGSQNNIQNQSNRNLPPIVVYQAEESVHSNNLKDESFFEKMLQTKGYFIDPIQNDSNKDFDDMNHFQFGKNLEQYENSVQK